MVKWISKTRRQANYGVVDALVFANDAKYKDESDEDIALAIHDWWATYLVDRSRCTACCRYFVLPPTDGHSPRRVRFLEQIPPATRAIAVALTEEEGKKARKFEGGSGLFDKDGNEIGFYMEQIIAEATRSKWFDG